MGRRDEVMCRRTSNQELVLAPALGFWRDQTAGGAFSTEALDARGPSCRRIGMTGVEGRSETHPVKGTAAATVDELVNVDNRNRVRVVNNHPRA